MGVKPSDPFDTFSARLDVRSQTLEKLIAEVLYDDAQSIYPGGQEESMAVLYAMARKMDLESANLTETIPELNNINQDLADEIRYWVRFIRR